MIIFVSDKVRVYFMRKEKDQRAREPLDGFKKKGGDGFNFSLLIWANLAPRSC